MEVKTKEEGFSLVVVIVFIALLSSLAIVAVRMGGLTAFSIYGEAKGKQAYYIAEAAYQHALFKLKENTAWRGDLINQPFAGGSYSVNVSQASPIDDLTITAVGSIGNTEQMIVRVIPQPVKPFIIKAFAGTGTLGGSGDGSPALNARLSRPRGIHTKGDNKVYIADTGNHGIRYVNTLTRNIYLLAGDYSPGYDCNNCQAIGNLLNSPQGVYAYQSGDVYIADTQNHIVRKVISNGNIVNVAGTPQWPGDSGDNGPATSAKLTAPSDVVLDGAGNIYIADTNNCQIRKVDTSGKITTFAGPAGPGSCGWKDGDVAIAKFNSPKGLAFDNTGNYLYIADTGSHRIRKINMATNIVTTVAGSSPGFAGDGGAAVKAKLNAPEGVAVNQFGTIYIADTANNRIRKIDPSTGIITTYAGTGVAGNTGDGGQAIQATLNGPSRVMAYDDVDGHILISDTQNHRIREVTNVY